MLRITGLHRLTWWIFWTVAGRLSTSDSAVCAARTRKPPGKSRCKPLNNPVSAALFHPAGGGLRSSDLPESVFAVESLPHSWLFPQMAAVVHHGGAGTTAAGLRAGVPSVLIPFMGDQPFWGRRVHDLGTGTKPIPRKQLTADKLAEAIETAVSDEVMRERAASLGERIRAENGVSQAVRLIERLTEQAAVPV